MSQIVVPAAARSVITPVMQTTFQVGTYTSLTDTFTKVVDLNDHQSFWLVKVAMPQPQKVYARSSTIRAAGERITAWNYKNRHITLTIQLLYQSGTTALLTAVRSLLAAIENPPYRVAFAPPNASVLTYADVVAVSHTIPTDGKIILAKAISNITIDFECAPGFSGDRITLSNLVVNPGFEAPSGPGIQVFSDNFANANAYSVQAGGAPTVAANVMTIPTGGRVAFGSPNWGAINQWAVRWQATSSSQHAFVLHYTDANNQLFWQADYAGLGAASALVQTVAGAAHVLSSSTITFSAATWYWLVATQFPAAPGTSPAVLVTIYADNSGAIGSVLGTFGPVATFDAVTALSGRPQLVAIGNSLPVGGAFNSVHTVSLFGPGAHLFVGSGGTGRASGAWEQNSANTYGGGAVTSFGAARIDLPPAGTVLALWQSYQGGAPAGTNAIPASAGQTLGLSAYARSSGLSGTAQIALFVEEYDASGAMLRGTTIQTLTGNQASWTQLAGTLTLGASTAYVDVQLSVTDNTTGASANGIVWFDNAQCWNQTTTGQTTMPYCELRFPQSPAQLLLTGLQGDMVAPAFTALGTYKASFGTQHTIFAVLGSKLTPVAAARLVGPALTSQWGTLGPTLDSSQLGGFYWTDIDTQAPGSYPTFMYALSDTPANLAGIYHLYERLWTTNNNFGAIQAQATTIISTGLFDPGYPTYVPRRSFVQGAVLNPLLSTNNWNVCDVGQIIIPPFGQDALLDNTQNFVAISPYWTDPNGNSYSYRHTWQALIPVDGSVLLANLVNGTTSQPTAAPWKWLYSDGLAQALGYEPSWHYSLEAAPLANPGAGIGGIGNTSNHAPSINPLADAYLLLDPNQSSNGVSGVAQLAGFMTDDNPAGTVLPLYAEMQYTPLYLYPRGQ